jgi:hypothetical protein
LSTIAKAFLGAPALQAQRQRHVFLAQQQPHRRLQEVPEDHDAVDFALLYLGLVISFGAIAILSSMDHSCHDDPLLRPIDFIYHNIRQSRHGPLERVRFATDVAHEREVDQ